VSYSIKEPLYEFACGYKNIPSRQQERQDGVPLANGDLLRAAEEAGFDVLLTTDKNMRSQQNFAGRRIAVVVLGNGLWPFVKPMLPQVAAAVNTARPGSYTEVEIPSR
jgi:hypothetical protein